MSDSRVTREGLEGVKPGRQAVSTYSTNRSTPVRSRKHRGGGEQPTVPEAEFRSYYGKPVLNKPVWQAPDIPGYLYLGGLSGGSALLAAAASLTGQRGLARVAKVGSASAIGLSLVALVHDLGRPSRFLNMLRVFKPTSPMSVGSWLLSAYAPVAAVAAGTDVFRRMPRLGVVSTAAAAVMGPAVSAYTGALISDTAVPAWHDGYREMPYLFVGSGAMAAGGLGMLAAPSAEQALPRDVAVFGLVTEFAASHLMKHRLGMVAEPYKSGKGGRLMKAGEALAAVGVAATLLGTRLPAARRLAGAALMVSSAATRFGIFEAGLASSEDPRYTVSPQRERAASRRPGADSH